MSKKSGPKGSNPSSAVAKIVGEGRDEWGERYLKLSVVDSDRDIAPFSVTELINNPKTLFVALANAGLNAFSSKSQAHFLAWLHNKRPKKATFKVVTRLGWNSGAYVFPDEIIGKPKKSLEPALGRLDNAMLRKYRVRGTLKQWQDQIAAPCKGNSRLMFAVSLAFTGPILPFVSGPKSGGFQFWGDGESGKTTAAMLAGSVWGCHRGEGRREKGFVESWNSTAGKVEVTALVHNDGLLILDETKRAGNNDKQRVKVVAEVVFKLAEHTEKERLTSVEPVRAWRCYFLSTSNLSFAQLGQAGGMDVGKPELGRLTDIPLPQGGYGIYQELHGFDDGEVLSDTLQRRSRRLYGTPIRAFVKRLVKDCQTDKKALKQLLAKQRKTYRRKLKAKVESEGLKPLNRISGRYATTFAAGTLAIEYGILLWNRKKLLKAILSCQLDQLRFGDAVDQSADPEAALRTKLAQYLHDNHSNFVNLQTKHLTFGTDNIEAFPGYGDQINGQTWYYLTAKKLSEIIGAGSAAKKLKQELASKGLLAKTGQKFVVQRRIFDGGKRGENHRWVHAFNPVLCGEAQQQ
jgi:putative DNA primase/helicase